MGGKAQHASEKREPAREKREPAREKRKPAREKRKPAREKREPAREKREPASVSALKDFISPILSPLVVSVSNKTPNFILPTIWIDWFEIEK